MTHPQVFGQKCTPIRKFLAWKTHPFWPNIPNMTQYGGVPPGVSLLLLLQTTTLGRSSVGRAKLMYSDQDNENET